MPVDPLFLNYYGQKIAEGREDSKLGLDKRTLPWFNDPSGGYALGNDSVNRTYREDLQRR